MNALDVSRWQGDINWAAVKGAGYQIAVIKISGGDDGLYYDSKANQNYSNAKANGLSVGGYHFAGGTDPVAEAEYFVKGMSPFEENDVFVLDWEVQNPDPVGWCTRFVNHVHDLANVWPLIYMNGSTLNSQDWSPVTNNCGVWVAWYGQDPNADLPVKYPYIMHQYTSGGSVPGISGNVDLDAWYYDIPTWDKYGWHAPQTPVEPKPPVVEPPVVEPPVVEPPVVEPPVVEPPVVEPPVVTPPVVEPPKPVVPAPIVIHTSADVHVNSVAKPQDGGVIPKPLKPKQNWLVRFLNGILYFFDIKVRKP